MAAKTYLEHHKAAITPSLFEPCVSPPLSLPCQDCDILNAVVAATTEQLKGLIAAKGEALQCVYNTYAHRHAQFSGDISIPLFSTDV